MRSLSVVVGIAAAVLVAATGSAEVTVTILFDNVVQNAELESGWGYACLVESGDATVLFDTGLDGDAVLANMAALGKDPAAIDAVVLSHRHGDHTAGLEAVLRHASHPRVLVLPDFPAEIAGRAAAAGARVVLVEGPMEVAPGIRTTGPVTEPLAEQALLVDSADGPIVITGCAHPGIVRMVERAVAVASRPPALVIGGFHLLRTSAAKVDGIAARLLDLGVERLGASHCTGEAALERLAAAFGPSYLRTGLGWSATFTTQ